MCSDQILPPADQDHTPDQLTDPVWVDLLEGQTIAIYGIGLMGGSMAKALRDSPARLIGIDPDSNTRELARKLQIVDQVFDYPPGKTLEPTIIILAAAVRTNEKILAELADIHAKPAVVIDLGSTKRTTLHAMENLPERFDPLGGHPMCGRETSGLANATAQLYTQAVFALCPLPRTSRHALTLIRALVAAVGARPYWVDAETHDRWVAATSHLPYLVSNALAAVTPEDVAPLIGPGFTSTSRLGASNLEMMTDILKSNRENILFLLRNYAAHLLHLETLLELEDYASIEAALQQAADHRKLLIQRKFTE